MADAKDVGRIRRPQGRDVQGGDMHEGRLVRVDSHGFGFIESTGGSQYAFTFDQIEGYRGQRLRELGLKEGVIVRFSVQDGLIKDVVISSLEPAGR